MVKNPPAIQEMQETWVRSLGREDPLEEEMETHSSVLAWRNPQTRDMPGGYSPWVTQSRTQLSNEAGMQQGCPYYRY